MKVVKGTNFQVCNVKHDKYNLHYWMLYMKVVRRVNPGTSLVVQW